MYAGMYDAEGLARVLDGLSHPLRILIVALLADGRERYLSEIAEALGISRALAKIHLKKMEKAGLVTSNTVLAKGAQALLYFKLVPFELDLSPQKISKLVRGNNK